jgi:hypothetical protein
MGDWDPRLSRVAEQLDRRLQPARIVERAPHDQGHAGEALGLDRQHRAAARAEASGFLSPAITRVGEAVGRAVKRERLVWYRHDLDESRSALFLAVCAMASGDDLGLTCCRVADVAAEAPAIHVRHAPDLLSASDRPRRPSRDTARTRVASDHHRPDPFRYHALDTNHSPNTPFRFPTRLAAGRCRATPKPASLATEAFPLLPEGGDDLARGVDAEPRPQDRKIEPGGAVFGETIAAPADRTNQADRVEHPVTQRIAAYT